MTPVEYAQGYAAIGWHVFPIERGTKRPIGKLTPNGHLQATVDAAQIAAWWAVAPDAGIGIAVRASRLVVVDVDPRNGGHFDLERIETERGKLATDVEAYTGGGGQHLVFLAPAEVGNLPGKLARGIDLKSDGYIVVEPSLHPSGRSYEWEASSSPLDGCVPSPLPGWIADMARPGLPAAMSARMDMAPAALDRSDAELAEIRAALAMIPSDERDTWVAVGMALHKDVGGALGFDLWSTWSQTSSKFDGQDQQRVWRSFTRKPMGQAVQLGTVFDLAYKHGFERLKAAPAPVVVPVGEPDPRTANTAPELVDGPKVAALAMPVQGLNDLARWVFDSCPHAHPLLAQATALALVSTCAGRRYVSEFGDPAHVFFGLLAPTTSQARPLLAAAEGALMDLDLRRMVRSQRLASAQQVYSSFIRSPSVLYAADDWGDQLVQAKRQPSGLLTVAHGVLAGRIHAGKTVALDNWAEIGEKRPDDAPKNVMPTLYSPALTLLAAVAESQMRSVFKLAELGRGALDCMLFIPATDLAGWVDRNVAAAPALPAAAATHLRWMRGIEPGTVGEPDDVMLGNQVLIKPTPIVVRFACDLSATEQRWIASAQLLPPRLRPLSWSARTTVRRLCVAVAAFAAPVNPVVTPEMLAWCERFVRECLDVAIAEFNLLGSDEDDVRPDAGEYVLELITRAGPAGVPKRDLPKYSKAYKRLDTEQRAKLIGQMLEDDFITEVPSPGGRGHVYVARQFVREVPIAAPQRTVDR
jgi:hypothetical protein